MLKVFFRVLQISEKRLRTLREKVENKRSLSNLSGKYAHKKKLTSTVIEIIFAHCYSLPHNPSHYRRENSTLLYFEDSSLTLTRLYQLFLIFYQTVTGEDKTPISEVCTLNFSIIIAILQFGRQKVMYVTCVTSNLQTLLRKIKCLKTNTIVK